MHVKNMDLGLGLIGPVQCSSLSMANTCTIEIILVNSFNVCRIMTLQEWDFKLREKLYFEFQ